MKKDLKKALTITWTFIKYCLYFLLTLNARTRYLKGQQKGMHCYKSEHGFDLLGNYMDYYYDPNKKPERDYLTWKEFKR